MELFMLVCEEEFKMKVLKKSLVLLLVGALLVSCLTGCNEKPEPVTPTGTEVTKPIEKPAPVAYVNREDAVVLRADNKDDEVFKKFDSIYKEMENYLDTSIEFNEYSNYPTEKYCYPFSFDFGSGLKTVYVEASVGSCLYNSDEYQYYTLMMDSANTTGSLKADMFSASSSSDIGSVIGSVVGGVSDLFSSTDDVASLSEGVVGSEGFSDSEIIIEPEFNTSEYKDVKEKGFSSVKTSPLSTFAADVDTASYTNMRSIIRKLAGGRMGSYSYGYTVDSLHDIRIEEMLNYFNYDFSGGTQIDDTFTVTAEVSATPWNKDTQLMVLNVKAKDLPVEESTGSNLVFLVDVSGSMHSSDKIDLVKESLSMLTNELSERDTISIVTYSGSEQTLLEGATGADKAKIKEVIMGLSTGGGTNGEGGIKQAYKIAEKYKEGHSNSRIIMCSDGDLNVGISSEDALIDLVEKKRETGIYLSVLGFGDGNYKDNKMEALADNGNGNYYYIDDIKEAHKVLVEDLLSTLVTVADDVKFQVEFNPQFIKGYRKIGYENRDMANEDFHDDTKDGGEVGYGQEVTIVYELVPVSSSIEIAGSDLKYQESAVSDSSVEDWLTVSVRKKSHGASESTLSEYVVSKANESANPSDTWKFISDVVAFGLLLNDSDYIENYDVSTIISNLDKFTFVDEDKKEFVGLVICYRNYLESLSEVKD